MIHCSCTSFYLVALKKIYIKFVFCLLSSWLFVKFSKLVFQPTKLGIKIGNLNI